MAERKLKTVRMTHPKVTNPYHAPESAVEFWKKRGWKVDQAPTRPAVKAAKKNEEGKTDG